MKLNSRFRKNSDLFEAVMSGRLDAVAGVLERGSNINDQDADGFTAVMLAAARGHANVVRYLLQHKAEADLRNDIGQTALMVAARGGHEIVVDELIAAGANPRAVDNEKRSTVAWAVSGGDFPKIVTQLVSHGADCNLPDESGVTPLMRTALLGHTLAGSALLAAGANPKIQLQGKTAYDMAADRGLSGFCEMMEKAVRDR